MRNPRHYSNAAMLLVWLGVVALAFTFWAGVACLASHFIKG
jgi:hypothetical protein